MSAKNFIACLKSGPVRSRCQLVRGGLTFVLGCVLVLAAPGIEAAALSRDDAKHYEAAFQAAGQNKWQAAFLIAGRTTESLPRKALQWLYYRDPANKATFDEIADFVEINPDWPSLGALRKNAELRLKDAADPTRLLAWFADSLPITLRGVLRYAEALSRNGETAALTDMLRKSWVGLNMTAAEEREFRVRYRKMLRPGDNLARLERLLWAGKTSAARRQARRVGDSSRLLAEARIALRRKKGGVDGAIARVPENLLSHPGLVYERLRWRRRKGFDDKAVELLADQPETVKFEKLWWRERSILARRFLREGEAQKAYAIAEDHRTTGGYPHAEAEWLAGFIALQFLNDPETAFVHFQTMYNKVRYPISLSRGAYWAGRAAEAAGKSLIAYKWYDVAARHVTSFYGQMAAYRLSDGKPPSLPREPEASEAQRQAFAASELARVIPMLTAARAGDVASDLLRYLGRSSGDPANFALSAALAIEVDLPGDAVYIARQAIKAGVILSVSGYPTLTLKPGLPLPLEIVFGLVRQESGFDRQAISPAGARGLMQLLPATAKVVARQQKLKYRRAKLLDDVNYNITLGTAYLNGLLGKTDGSLVMALAGYNAGPRRMKRWVRESGDPRASIEAAIDWIEMIPFSETRDYVQRVLENITVYRQRNSARPVLVAFDTQTISSSAAGLEEPGQ